MEFEILELIAKQPNHLLYIVLCDVVILVLQNRMENLHIQQKPKWIIYVHESEFVLVRLDFKDANILLREHISYDEVVVAVIYNEFVSVVYAHHSQLGNVVQAVRNAEEISFVAHWPFVFFIHLSQNVADVFVLVKENNIVVIGKITCR